MTTPLWTCPRCGEAALSVSNAEATGPRQPEPGDFAICEGCGEVIRFVSMSERPWVVRVVEEHETAALGPEFARDIEKARSDIGYKKMVLKTQMLVELWLFREREQSPAQPRLAFRELPPKTSVHGYLDQVLDVFPVNAAAKRLCEFIIDEEKGVTLMMLYAVMKSEPQHGNRYRVDWFGGFPITANMVLMHGRSRTVH